jgi:molybdenum cofactor biosynthesis enzyme MoaA
MTVHLPPELVKSYLSPEQVEALVPGMTKGKLAQLRFTGKGPRYRKPTPKTVLYVAADIYEWVEESARSGTAPEAV